MAVIKGTSTDDNIQTSAKIFSRPRTGGDFELGLEKLKAEGVSEKVNPAEPVDCNLNIAISEKKAQGSSRMNIGARHYNKGAKRTRYHVTTPQEARHKLKGDEVYSKFDKGKGFHQVPLAAPSQVILQSHLGLHRMKRWFLGPTNSSGIFHHA